MKIAVSFDADFYNTQVVYHLLSGLKPEDTIFVLCSKTKCANSKDFEAMATSMKFTVIYEKFPNAASDATAYISNAGFEVET